MKPLPACCSPTCPCRLSLSWTRLPKENITTKTTQTSSSPETQQATKTQKRTRTFAEILDKDNKGRIETFLQGTVLPESSNDRNAWAVLLNTLEKQKIKWRDDHQSVIFLRKKLKKIDGIQGTLPADMSLTNYIDNLRISKGIASNLPSNYKFEQVDLEDPTQTARQNLVLLSLAAEFKNPLQAFKDEKFVDNVI